MYCQQPAVSPPHAVRPRALELVEDLGRRPAPDEVAVGEQHRRRARAGREDRDRLAGLDDERLAVLERGQRAHDRLEAGVVARRLRVRGVDDELLGRSAIARLFSSRRRIASARQLRQRSPVSARAPAAAARVRGDEAARRRPRRHALAVPDLDPARERRDHAAAQRAGRA